LRVEVLAVRLILVLGHTDCGAIAATLAPKLSPDPEMVPNHLGALTGRISTTLDGWNRSEGTGNQPPSGEAERFHAGAIAKELVQQSELLASAVRSGELLIAGSTYDLKSGQVDFFDEDFHESAPNLHTI
jgi:carbonic anhydrase